MEFVNCINKHRVNEFAIETDGSCMMCEGNKPCPSVEDLQRLDIGDALYYTQESQSMITGKASYMKLRYNKTFKTMMGVIERIS